LKRWPISAVPVISSNLSLGWWILETLGGARHCDAFAGAAFGLSLDQINNRTRANEFG
jgi:hypothetical protein